MKVQRQPPEEADIDCSTSARDQGDLGDEAQCAREMQRQRLVDVELSGREPPCRPGETGPQDDPAPGGQDVVFGVGTADTTCIDDNDDGDDRGQGTLDPSEGKE